MNQDSPIDSLHVITTLGVGGAEVQLVALLNELRKRGHHAVVQPVRPPLDLASRFQDAGIPVLDPLVTADLPSWQRLPRAASALRRSIPAIAPGIVHAHLPEAELVASLAASSRPLVLTRHTALPFALDRSRHLSRLLSRWAERRSRQVVAISEFVGRNAIDCGELGTSPIVIPYGISIVDNTDRYSADLQDDGPLRLGCAARLVPGKGIETLVESLPIILSQSHRQVRLTIAGDGPLRGALEVRAAELGVERYVDFQGRVENMSDFYAGLDLFILPSESEGLGLVLLEAMSHGVPVIAADNTAMVEVCDRGRAGALFTTGDPRDLALKVIDHEPAEVRSTLSRRGMLRVTERYSMPAIAEATLGLYASVSGETSDYPR